MSKDVTFFFPTRNRPDLLERTLDALDMHCPDCTVLVGNCSSKKNMDIVSEIIGRYKFAKEFQYDPDPGMGDVFTDLFDRIETKYAVCYADDVFLMRNIQNLVDCFEDEDIMVVALPMIDDTSNAPSRTTNWPKDEFGCVVWLMANNGRWANHVMVRMDYFKDHGIFFGYTKTNEPYNIDCYFHMASFLNQRIYPNDGAYLYHVRYDDDTRINSVISGDRFRYPVGHYLRVGSTINKASDRE